MGHCFLKIIIDGPFKINHIYIMITIIEVSVTVSVGRSDGKRGKGGH